MNLTRLEYFLIIAETGNLARASEILHVSSAALSKAMKVLEDDLKVSLWIREGRKLILSDSGKVLLSNAQNLLLEAKNIKEKLLINIKERSPIRIGTFEVFSTYFLSFLNKLGWDEQRLELHELLPGEVEKYVSSGDLDLGITYIPVPQPQLDFLKIASIEMGVFIQAGAFSGISQKNLPFVVPVVPFQDMPTRVRGLDGWPPDVYERKVFYRVTLLESALELCRQGRAAGYFPIFIAREHNLRVKKEYRLERCPSPYPGRICRSDVYIIKRKSSEETSIIKQIAKAIRLIC